MKVFENSQRREPTEFMLLALSMYAREKRKKQLNKINK